MAQIFLDNVRETTSTTGTGTLTLTGRVAQHRSFADAGAADGSTVDYTIVDGFSAENGTGTYSTSGTLTRDMVYASTAGGTTKLTLSGSAQVWADVRANRFAGFASPDYSNITNLPFIFNAGYIQPAGTIQLNGYGLSGQYVNDVNEYLSIDLYLRKVYNTSAVVLADWSGSKCDVPAGLSVNGTAIVDASRNATFTSLALASGGTVTAFDTDATLAANSDAVVATQKAVKSYVDNLVAGLKWKASVRVATTANGTLTTAFANGQTVDGVTLATGDRILLKDQSTGSQNGIYTVNASGSPTRATDADTGTELVSAAVFVQSGTANADKAFVCTNDTITLGSTSLTFTAFSSVAGALSATNNLSDLANAGTARTNLGLGALATVTPGTGVATALAINTGSAGAVALVGGAIGTPTSGNLANCTAGVSLASVYTASGASSATLADVTGMSLSLAAATKYRISAYVPYSCVAAVGYKIGFAASSGLTTTTISLSYDDPYETSGGVAYGPRTTLAGITAPAAAGQTSGFCRIEGFILTAVAGTLTLQFASGANNNTATAKAGCTLVAQPIG